MIRFILFFLAVVAASTLEENSGEPVNNTLHHRQSEDHRCGDEFGTSCDNECCSVTGWCGTGYVYCSSPSCQLDYGRCDGNTRPDGPDTEAVARDHKGPVPYGQAIYHCEEYGEIALTFDDGPYVYTKDLLDLLKSHNAKATFFITGRNLGKGAINDRSTPWPWLIRRMVDEGHQIASHTWSHQRLTTLSEENFRKQMLFNEIAFADLLGYFPTYMRPPYSASNDTVDGWLGRLGYHVTYFNLDTEGYLHNAPGEIQASKDIWDRAVERADPTTTKWLAIEHDPAYQSVHNLTAHALESLSRNGFKSVTVAECLGDRDKANWYRTVPGAKPKPPDGPGPTYPPTGDGRCGGAFGGQTCAYEPQERCCSGHGWCGGDDHCHEGCQPLYGLCE